MDVRIEPATPERWDAVETLFGRGGAYGGCWCAWWRLKRSEFDAAGSAGRKRVLRDVVEEGSVPGLLAFAGDEPVAWCAVAPRDATPSLGRSPLFRTDDTAGVWAITCFFVRKDWRGKGLMERLVQAAVEHARTRGARAVDAIPLDTDAPLTGYQGFTGVASVYERLGFREIERRKDTRPLMRLDL